MRLARLAALVAVLALASQLSAADKRPMVLADMFAVKRVAAPQISPDGKRVVYQVTTVDLQKNKTHPALWIAATDGKTAPKQLTPKNGPGKEPRWSPDGKWVLFESDENLWVIPASGGDPRQVTNISTGASHGIWAPDGKSIAFVSAVYPEFSEKPFAESDKLNKEKADEIEKSPVKAKTFTKLFYRHWDDYVGDKRQHIFVSAVDGTKCRDVTPGDRDAYPTSDTFESDENFTFTPDGKYIVFTAPPAENEAWSTNYDLCRVSVTNTSAKWETLTADNKAADSGPKFSADGKRLMWRAQKKAGYEADNWFFASVETDASGKFVGKPVYEELAVSLNELPVLAGLGLHWIGDYKGQTPVFYQGLLEGKREPFLVLVEHHNSSLCANQDGTVVCFLHSSFGRPPEVCTLSNDPKAPGVVNLSRVNDKLLAELDLPQPESVEVPVEGGVKMQMWVLKPPGFDEKKKWPVAFLVHGGPQGAWNDTWSYRWNPQLWAAQGYIVVLPNPRGSTGFGQKFVDEVTGDWGGKCYRDLLAGLDYVEKLPYVDKERIAAAGASFGGYMMNWFAVNDVAKRFKCLISHASVWNFESEWATTDELWCDEWEHAGLPWTRPLSYAKFSPHKRAGELKTHKTPMLVIQNDQDFRCPVGQGHELFAALQRQGVPSRFVNFPDEGHWVLKPKNSEYWHKEVFAWLKKYAPPGGR
jgi:dipeptidyl aminopeptidase/acylaminoacyl peptidase